jgi:hypothetical protein
MKENINEVIQSSKHNIQELIDMGFAESIVQEAIQVTETQQEAIEYIVAYSQKEGVSEKKVEV